MRRILIGPSLARLFRAEISAHEILKSCPSDDGMSCSGAPAAATSWFCGFSDTANHAAYAVCAKTPPPPPRFTVPPFVGQKRISPVTSTTGSGVLCDFASVAVGGGCDATSDSVQKSCPSDDGLSCSGAPAEATGWFCGFSGTAFHASYVSCARLKPVTTVISTVGTDSGMSKSCPSGYILSSGGCDGTTDKVLKSCPSDDGASCSGLPTAAMSWYCGFSGNAFHATYATCIQSP